MLNSNKIQNSCKCHFFDVKMAFHKTQHIKSATFTYREREERKSKCAWNKMQNLEYQTEIIKK